MKKLLVLFIFIIFVSCTKKTIEIKNFNNPKYGEFLETQLRIEDKILKEFERERIILLKIRL